MAQDDHQRNKFVVSMFAACAKVSTRSGPTCENATRWQLHWLTMDTTTRWAKYVNDAIRDHIPAEAARRSNLSRSTITRWMAGSTPDPKDVIRFARAYGRSPGSALVAAGYLTDADLDGEQYDISSVPDDALLDEVRRRFNR